MASSERRAGARVKFERSIDVCLMAIDGTWRRNCSLEDVSEVGAKLIVKESIEGLQIKEFFLLLSSTGLAYRRCELVWVNGEQLGARFIAPGPKKRASKTPVDATSR